MATEAVNTLGQGAFLKLLVTQLQNQNPLDPVKDTDFIAQLAQFSTLQSIEQLNTSFDQTLKLQQLTGGASLIGHVVQFGDFAGRVSSVNVQNGDVLLQVGTRSVPLNSVTGVVI